MSHAHTDASGEARLDEILAEYLEAQERGESPSREKLLEAHPEFAEEIICFLEDQDRFGALMTPFAQRASHFSLDGSETADELTALPSNVGKYEIVEEIARGGMGVVYRARQRLTDVGLPARQVAVKMIRQSTAPSSEEARRFHLEAAAVSQLDHPNVIPLYDSGEDQGRPWFAMKLIEGGSLSQHKEKLKGRPRVIAELMLAITRAIEHAHQRGILHRDLKPGNVLIDEQGRPMVTDFGLAKAFSESQHLTQSRETPPSLTQSGTMVGTPSYLAPEQARGGKNVTTATDVYGLGAILYELLTGRPPFLGLSPMDTVLDLLEKDPPAPRSIDPHCDRDLETICLKCLEKEPERRFTTATAVAEELERFLRNEPLLTRPLGTLQRWARWYRRQPLVAGLLSTVLLLVMLGVGLVFWQWNRAETHLKEAIAQKQFAEQQKQEADIQRRTAEAKSREADQQRKKAETKSKEADGQRARAEEESKRAQRERKLAHKVVMEFCLQLSREQLALVEGLQPLQRELLESGLNYLRGFLVENQNDPQLRREVADACYSLGLITNVIGSRTETLKLYQSARDQYRELTKDDPKGAHFRNRVAACSLNLSNVLKEMGKYPEAEQELLQAQEEWQKLLIDHPGNRSWQLGIASTYTNRAGLRGARGRGDEAFKLHQQARKAYQSLVQRDGADWDAVGGLAGAQHNVGVALIGQGKLPEGVKELQESMKWRENLRKARPRDLWNRRRLAQTHNSLADAYTQMKQNEKAFGEYDKALSLLRPLVDANPEVIDFRDGLAAVLQNQGNLFHQTKQDLKAFHTWNEALQHLLHLVKDNPKSHHFRSGLAQTSHNLGNVLRDHNELEQAIHCFTRAAQQFELLIKESPEHWSYHDYLAGTSSNLGDALQKAKRHEEAIARFRVALESQKIIHQKRPKSRDAFFRLSRCYGNLARAHRIAKLPKEAVVISLQRRKMVEKDPDELLDVLKGFLLAAQLVDDDKTLQKVYRQHALDTLKMVMDAGYRDVDKLRTLPEVVELRKHFDVDALLKR